MVPLSQSARHGSSGGARAVKVAALMNSDLATAVITHRIGEDRHGACERWLEEVEPRRRSMPVRRDWQVVRPVAGLTDTCTAMIRFDTQHPPRQWMVSPHRHRRCKRLRPLFSGQDSSDISSSLAPWFPRGVQVQAPVRRKHDRVTWSAICPPATGAPQPAEPALNAIALHPSHPLTMLAVTGGVVFLMVYVVMPRCTRLIRQWLFN